MIRRLLKDRLKDNNKGIALVTVIVAIGFISALVSILLMTTLVNFKMKSVNARGKDTFYSAEQALDEINVGLQRIVSDSMSDAYLDIMTNYATYTSKQKEEKMTVRYYENLWSKLEDTTAGSGHNKYDVTKLDAMLKDTTKWHGDDENGYGAIVVAVSDKGETKSGDMVTYLNDGVVLKNIKVYYKDPKGFVSVIQTDIRLTYPKFDFAASSELPNLPYYSVIADRNLKMEVNAATGSGVSLELEGNIYANNIEMIGKTGVKQASVKAFGEALITTKYDLSLDNVTYSNEERATTWAKNVVVKSSNAELNGVTNVANDLNVKGTQSVVKLNGEYMGYGSVYEYDDANANDPSYNSSAILVNGTKTTLDFSGLNKITIAGRAYLGTSSAKVADSIAASNPALKDNPPVPMGESIAVKSNQLLYLVPACAIGVDETSGRSMYNKNPLTLSEYEAMMNQVEATASNTEHRIVEVSDQVEVPSLGTSLESYVRQSKGLPTSHKVFVQVSDAGVGSLVYYYMDFLDENEANRYYSAYYGKNKESVNEYLKFYLDEVKFPAKIDDLVTFKTAGNILLGKSVDKDTTKDGFDNNPSSLKSASSQLQGNDVKYSTRFKAMCTNLVTNIDETGHCQNSVFAKDIEEDLKTPANQVVFENLLNISAPEPTLKDKPYNCTVFGDAVVKNGFEEFMYVLSSGNYDEYDGINVVKKGTYYEFVETATSKVVAIVSDSNNEITIGSSYPDVALVIAAGNVNISRDYNGLVLANGVVNVAAGVKVLKADPEIVRKYLQVGVTSKDNNNVYTIAYALNSGDEYIYSSLDNKGDTANLALGGLISYENWKKE